MNTAISIPTPQTVLGNSVPQSSYHPVSVVGEVGDTPAGNVFVRVGQMRYYDELNRGFGAHGWEQTECVVLTRDEALDLIKRLTATVSA